MSKVKSITADEWISEAFPAAKSRPENSFTINEVMKKTGYSRTTVSRIIGDRIESGELTETKIIIDNRVHRVFTPVKGKINAKKGKNRAGL